MFPKSPIYYPETVPQCSTKKMSSSRLMMSQHTKKLKRRYQTTREMENQGWTVTTTTLRGSSTTEPLAYPTANSGLFYALA
jgi:hypothetical protein